MTTKNSPLFAKLVLCTSGAAAYYSLRGDEDAEYDPDYPDAQRIHGHLVAAFRRAFGAMVVDLEILGFEVITEFYVDTLIDEDYELSVGHDDQDEVRELVEAFHQKAEAILMDLPAVLDAPAQAEAIS
ncbi:hypothetical protein [Pelagibacterium lacus]|uniref:Uncharacterized protein n=1 Tax=Pelagibacterium lacus TaxID=2282655 RepID=A0A369W5Q4_9HYPH|nr:hypothetical protein [Pelagibacterium lacus]RDE09888.1 hypothetical protein DVH29_04980 [Pelagibacterium lacus]